MVTLRDPLPEIGARSVRPSPSIIFRIEDVMVGATIAFQKRSGGFSQAYFRKDFVLQRKRATRHIGMASHAARQRLPAGC